MASERISAKALFIMVKEGHATREEQVRRSVRKLQFTRPAAGASPF